MADRVSASITIGGELPAASLTDLLAAIEGERYRSTVERLGTTDAVLSYFDATEVVVRRFG